MVTHKFLPLLLLVVFVLHFSEANARCIQNSMFGVWENSAVKLREPAQIEIINACRKGKVIIRTLSKCYPGNCIWGRKAIIPAGDNVLEVKYRTFMADRKLKIERFGSKIMVHYRVDFRDANNKPAQSGTIIMHRQ
jgi:hypothetical protein